jgi:hypothetical protein
VLIRQGKEFPEDITKDAATELLQETMAAADEPLTEKQLEWLSKRNVSRGVLARPAQALTLK